MELNSLRDEIYENAKAHGFYDTAEDRNVLVKLMLIVSELGEACEAYRKDKWSDYNKMKKYNKKDFEKYIKDTFEDEIADAIIRLLDLCGFFEIDIDKAIGYKMMYNKGRPYKHGKRC